ncbi:Molybdopterin biosynthesis protein MoeA [Paenibacillus pasadenensis]|uniref:Molybdopterin molybdenumtransferase n=1 Tax=Paenibacillus pasadenensis TaxID=217090 RepID=A0A2N5N3D6_9BACL|nr:molybdopterin-binding protein [Paenibacillus pasadenensis]PLT44857.1 Molybdopterin biosynthesis protein MoeA [Paenibacillus pasadenensis]
MSIRTRLREVPVEQALGLRLAHDLTRIVPGSFKGRAFVKGHVVTEADIPALLDIGKAHLYVMELAEGELHEDEAALRMAEAHRGERIELGRPHEGKVALKSSIQGLVKIDPAYVNEINDLGDIALATVVGDRLVEAGGQVAATRVIPLVVEEALVSRVEELAARFRERHGRAPIEVKPLRPMRIGLITTGGEVYSGRIEDRFGPAVRAKLERLGSSVSEQALVPDDRQRIVDKIVEYKDKEYDMILLTGGMSVDPDDRTPGAIRAAGTDIVRYGTPMLPGSMLLMGYLGGTPVLGLPGCVMHDPHTSFDVLLPRLLAGEEIRREDITAMGYGGLYGC